MQWCQKLRDVFIIESGIQAFRNLVKYKFQYIFILLVRLYKIDLKSRNSFLIDENYDVLE